MRVVCSRDPPADEARAGPGAPVRAVGVRDRRRSSPGRPSSSPRSSASPAPRSVSACRSRPRRHAARCPAAARAARPTGWAPSRCGRGQRCVEAVLYFAWPLARRASPPSSLMLSRAGRRSRPPVASARNVYRIAVFPRERAGRGRWPTCGPPATSATPSAPGRRRRAGRSAPGEADHRRSRSLTAGLLVLNAVHDRRGCPAIARPGRRCRRRRSDVHVTPAALKQPRLPGAGGLQRRALPPTRCCSTSSYRCGSSSAPTPRRPCWPGCFGTNTVLAVLLQVRAVARVADSVDGSLRAVRWSGWAFVAVLRWSSR